MTDAWPWHHHTRVVMVIKVSRGHHHDCDCGHGHRRRRHRHRWRLVQRKVLQPGMNKMADVTLSVGHTASFAIEYDDQNGNPMLTTPTPDAPPAWTDAPNPAGCVTFTVAGDSNSATDVAVAAGVDTVGVSLGCWRRFLQCHQQCHRHPGRSGTNVNSDHTHR